MTNSKDHPLKKSDDDVSTPIKPMGSVAAMINPINKGEVLLFYCTDTYNLAVEHRALNESAQSTVYVDNNIDTGNITQPGDFAAVLHNNIIKCYGITNFTGGDGKLANVASSLSPSINPIDQITNTQGTPPVSSALTGSFSALAACTDGQFSDFVSFIQPVPTDPALPLLVEYTTTISDTSFVTYPLVTGALLPASRLTSCYRTDDPNGNRYIFCQSTIKGSPLLFMSTDTGAPNPIPGTGTASPGNPMAVTTMTNKDGRMNMYLIFMDSGFNLNKIVYNGTTMSWGPATQIATSLEAGSGMAVVNDGKTLYAFYARSGATVFTMYKGAL